MSLDLNDILIAVAKGRLSPAEAKAQIEKGLEKGLEKGVGDGREVLATAFDKLRKNVHVDELLKISSGLVQQIAENMPGQIEKFHENLSHNIGSINALGFSAGTPGVDAKLSVFRTFHVGADSEVEGNQVVGSQWFGVNFDDRAVVRDNKFTAVQFSEVAALRSTLSGNTLGLSRLSNVTLEEARVAENRISRSTFSDVSFTESDLEKCRLVKSEISQTVLNASRLSECSFDAASFAECEFDSCELVGVTFENCSFRECSFEEVQFTAQEPLKIVGVTLTGRTFHRIRSAKSFQEALGSPAGSLDEKQPEGDEAKQSTAARGRGRKSNSNRGVK
jgi:uncharacterized protein YjbI with pentapeptide repeats